MSLGGAFVNAVEAMLTQSDAMGVISQNVANVNTPSYKSSTDNFQTLLSEYNAAAQTDIFGVQPARTQQIDKQGALGSSDQWNDLAISGPGFFVVNNQIDGQGTNYFTRDGLLNQAAAPITGATQGATNAQTQTAASAAAAASTVYLTDSDGDYLMGWQATNGAVMPSQSFASLSAVNFQQGSGIAGQATSQVSVQAVLPSGSSTLQSLSAPIYDTEGNAQTLQMNFQPVGADNYGVSFSVPPATAAGTVNDPVPPNTITFSSGGTFTGSSAPNLQIAWNNDTTSNITLDLSKMVEDPNATNLDITNVKQNGVAIGTPGTTPTSTVALTGTLPQNGPIGASYTSTMTVVDNQYLPHTLQFTFTQTAADTWTVTASLPPPPAPVVTVPSAGTMTSILPASASSAQALDFSGTAVSSGGAMTLPVTWADGTPGTISVDMSSLLNQPSTSGTGSFSNSSDGLGPSAPGGPAATTTVTVGGTLPAGGPDDQTTNIPVYDDQGNLYSLELNFAPNGGSSWNVTPTLVPAIALSPSSTSAGTTTPGTVTGGGTIPIGVTWPDGISASLNLDMSQLTTQPTQSGNGAFSVTADGQSLTTGNGLPTSNITVTGNLPEGSNLPQTVNVPVFDDKGNAYTLQLQLTPTGADSWNISPTLLPTVSFNGVGAATPPVNETVAVTWPDGTSSSIGVDLSQLTQVDTGSLEVQQITQNGYAPGNLTSVEFDGQGDLLGNYTDGQKVLLYQVPVATFTAPNALDSVSGNRYLPSQGSGSAVLNSLGVLTPAELQSQSTSSANTQIVPDSFEESNVDLGTQFTNMIQSQEAYNSAGQVFRVADEMLQRVRDLIT